MASFKYWLLILVCLFGMTAVAAQDETSETETFRLTYDGNERIYHVHLPEGYAETADPLPVIIAMHGAGGDGKNMEKITLYSDLADTNGFIAVYPNGLNGIWNDGRVGDSRVPSDLDDVGFISAIIDALVEDFNVDTSRVYATGYSMGGMMAFRLGCELQDKIAAVASVASTFPGYLIENCDPASPVPVLVVQGTEDDVIPWDGIRRGNFIIYLSAAETAMYWAAHNQCAPDPELVEGLDIANKDGTIIRQVYYTDCEQDAKVMIYVVAGGGHTWPGSELTATWGITSFDLYASPAIWQFFETHTLNKG